MEASSGMAELGLYLELLVFLLGTFLYGFLSRELLRQSAPTRKRGALLALVLALTLWYGGSLVDEIAAILVGGSGLYYLLGPALDVARGLAWLGSFPLLVHALWQLSEPAPSGARPSGWWIVPGYLSWATFAPAAVGALRPGSLALAQASWSHYPRVLVHVTLCCLMAARLLRHAARTAGSPHLTRFYRWLLGSLLAVLALVVTGALVRVFHSGAWAETLWRLTAEGAGLVPGATFVYSVQRHNLLQLSVSHRSLRHFVHILALVLLVMVAGPAVAPETSMLVRRFVAWGLLLALATGLLYSPLMDLLARRSARWRRLLGRALTPEAVDQLTERLSDPGLSEDDAMAITASTLSRLLATRARFFTEPESNAETAKLLWKHFELPEARAFNRLDAPTPDLAAALADADWHAVFPLRVQGAMLAVLALEASSTGGGYRDGEMESIRLVLRQLEAATELKRLMEARLLAERRAAEEERLRMLGLVSASLAHEMKNPLSSMKTLAQTVHEEIDNASPGSEQSRDLELIVEQIDRLNGVAREVLGFARLGGSTAVALAELVRSCIYVLDHEARRRGVQLDSRRVRSVGLVGGTAATWQTIIFNLLLNAIQHSPPGSTVGVVLSRTDTEIHFETENAGPAVPSDLAARLFEPFVSSEGTGLGLSLVSRRVRELGGTVGLTNEENHIVFTIDVPRHALAPGTLASEPEPLGEEEAPTP